MAHRSVGFKQVPVMVEGGKDIDFRKMTVGTVRGSFTVVVCPWCTKHALHTGGYVHTGQEINHRGNKALLEGKVCTIETAMDRLHNKAEWSISALKNMDLTRGHFMEAHDRGMILLKGLRTAIGNVRRGICNDIPSPNPGFRTLVRGRKGKA